MTSADATNSVEVGMQHGAGSKAPSGFMVTQKGLLAVVAALACVVICSMLYIISLVSNLPSQEVSHHDTDLSLRTTIQSFTHELARAEDELAEAKADITKWQAIAMTHSQDTRRHTNTGLSTPLRPRVYF